MAIITLKFLFLGGFFFGCLAASPSKLNGGMRVKNRNFNYHVSVQFLKNHFCSGVIISKSYILSSASCILLEKGGDMMVIIGNLQILTDTYDKLNTNGRGVLHQISYTFIHEEYDAQHFWINDIAILKTEKPFTYTPTCSKIALSSAYIRFQTTLLVTGWADNPDNYGSSHSLRLGTVKTLSFNDCKNRYHGFKIFFSLEICVKATAGITFSSGDSGNPLIVNNHLVGITSVLSLQNTDTIVITRIRPHIPWIKKVLSRGRTIN